MSEKSNPKQKSQIKEIPERRPKSPSQAENRDIIFKTPPPPPPKK